MLYALVRIRLAYNLLKMSSHQSEQSKQGILMCYKGIKLNNSRYSLAVTFVADFRSVCGM